MTAIAVNEQDLVRLGSLLDELIRAGRTEEAEAVARVYALVQELVLADLFPALDDNDPEFARMMDEAERDIQMGRLIPHDEIVRRLQAPGDA